MDARFVSYGNFNPTVVNKPLAFQVSLKDWNNFGLLKGQYEYYKLKSFKLELIPLVDRAFYQPGTDGKPPSASTVLPTIYYRYVSKPPSVDLDLQNYCDTKRVVMSTDRVFKMACRYPKYTWNDNSGNLFIASGKKWIPVDTSLAFYGPCIQTTANLVNEYKVKLTSYVGFKTAHYQAGNTIKIANMPALINKPLADVYHDREQCQDK